MSATYLFVKNVKTRDPLAKLVLITLSQYADWETGICWPSAAKLAADCECTERSIRAKLELLGDMGLIIVQDRPGKTPLIKIQGYEEWYLAGQKWLQKTPENISGVHPGKFFTPEKFSDEHSYNNPSEGKNINTHPRVARVLPEGVARESEASIGDSLDRSPPTPLPSEIEGYGSGLEAPPWEEAPPAPATDSVSNQIENPSSPVDSPNQGARGRSGATQAKGVARRAAEKSRADAISTKDWLKVSREEDPENFEEWAGWMDGEGYVAQVFIARRRGYVLVPALKLEDGAARYIEKFPLPAPA